MPPPASRTSRRHSIVLPWAKPKPSASAGILPARLVGVEERAFDLGGEALGARADRRGADDAGVGAPARHQPLDIVARHQHVGIGDDDPVAPRRLPALDDIVELGIGADAIVADQQARRNLGMRGHRAARDRRDRIGGVGDAEDDLVIGIVEGEDRGERLLAKTPRRRTAAGRWRPAARRRARRAACRRGGSGRRRWRR